jgi:hypothetical protein
MPDKQRAARYIRPLALERTEDGRWKAIATVQYATALFNAAYYVRRNGDVEMNDDVAVESALPLRREAFDRPPRHELKLFN